ncbi:MAG TPA: hypothetical protein VHH36_04800 [Candidatus Thermoplasmatota archaeon]|nr:hypothetical protein [Candidatus Thermoplasmatota archaeon]
MTCTYPNGPEEDWCERHRIDHAMIVGMKRRRGEAGEPPPRTMRIAAL